MKEKIKRAGAHKAPTPRWFCVLQRKNAERSEAPRKVKTFLESTRQASVEECSLYAKLLYAAAEEETS